MPLVKLNAGAASIVDNEWVFAANDEDLPREGKLVVCLSRYLADRDELQKLNRSIAVRLAPDDDPHELEPYLDSLSLIEVSFPKYVDGRGYSQAQLLRRRLGFSGELRAVGEVLRDQLFYMFRSGFDAFEFEPTSGEADVVTLSAINDFANAYQKAADKRAPLFARRVSTPADFKE